MMLSQLAVTVRRRFEPTIAWRVSSGDALELNEGQEYYLAFDRDLSEREVKQLEELGGEVLSNDLAVLAFRNFVGKAELAGIAIEVVSTKIGPLGVSRILEEVSSLASGLLFGVRSPT